ncbi:MAG: hypothetical protein AB1768_12320 [Pseudomonadota bacterium]|jgi:hypothetical protein
MPLSPAQLHLVLPGLLWPAASVNEAAQGLRLPALGTLRARGRTVRRGTLTLERWLASAFGLGDAEPPSAALRLLADGFSPGADAWICADPVHLRLVRDTVVIGGRDELDLSEAEARGLVAALNAHFADVGEFVLQRAECWALRLPRLPRIATHPLDFVRGRRMESFLPGGDEARQWLRLLNEIQTLLHADDINARRAASGRATANSVWFWGAGTLPAAARAPARRILSSHPIVRGLAQVAGVPAAAVPPALQAPAMPAQDTLIILEDLSLPAQNRDSVAWRQALQRLELDWFAPALQALKRGRFAALRMTALGDEGCIEWTVTRQDLWKLWRRPVAPRQLAAAGAE